MMSGENPARFQVGWGLDFHFRPNDEGLRKVSNRVILTP